MNSTSVTVENKTLHFQPGLYRFTASYNYPQLIQLDQHQVLDNASQDLIVRDSMDIEALSFLSYSNKLVAGAWRFLTYFGRDTMISALLMQPILSKGNGSAIEAVIGSVLERLNRTDGSACHEETIGDYATYLNLQNNVTSTSPQCDYKMIDTDYYLPILLDRYFIQSKVGRERIDVFFSNEAEPFGAVECTLTYGNLSLISAKRIMSLARPFATNPTKKNLIHLKADQIVGEWRDSTYGIGGGRIPYDVNTALMPAALRSIASLARSEDIRIFPEASNWSTLADKYAKVWEDSTLSFFEVNVSKAEAIDRVESFVDTSTFYNGPSNSEYFDGPLTYYSLALDGYGNLSKVEVLNTDDCFRHFLLNTTDQVQLTSSINQTANNILRPFPAGLTTPLGVVVANPALAREGFDVLVTNFTNSAYHGTVIWSWQLAMMARGLEFQLGRCNGSEVPDFCKDNTVWLNVRDAYNRLWDVIEDNRSELSTEVWSWTWEGGKDGNYSFAALGTLPPPPGVGASTESDVRQLWSLAFLALQRNSAFA
ncbi:putative glycogen debranching enzyme [Phaeomoniella chlamydospora]|uniref:Putative glycogen debranching enzyme n=1 Tax=Phaeomoniella chlamydospora TaxID=158046 RepID=A0A0G2GBH4_PHACM|nr:putative glycogen debranching enzyme [Phaeomoniella chlamydospora]